MELAFGFLALIAILFFAMLPVIILLGLFGMAFKSLVAMLLFALKYLLPFGIIGLIVAKIRDKEEYFVWQEYLAHIGIAIGAGLVAIMIWLNIPVTPELPDAEAVKHISISYGVDDNTKTSSTETDWLIENIVGSLNSAEYKRTMKDFVEEDENDFEYTLILTDTEGKKYTVIFCNSSVIGIPNGLITSYYMMREGHGAVPQEAAYNIFVREKTAAAEAVWQPFAEELFSTVVYNEAEQAITFVIPDVIPEGNYEIDLYVEGSRGYTGGEFERREFFIYEDEQKNDLWVAGQEYSLPAEDICFSRLSITIDASYVDDPYVFDAFPLLPEEKVYNK